MDGLPGLRYFMGNRLGEALLVGGVLGLAGVLPDLDHLVCAAARNENFFEGYGCRLFHPLLLAASGALCVLSLACFIGFVGYLVGYTNRPAAGAT